MNFLNIFTQFMVIFVVLWTIIIVDVEEVSGLKTIRKHKLRLRRIAKKPQGNVKLKASFIIGKS